MKRFLIFLLAFVFSFNPFFCYASDDFDYGIDEATDVNFNETISVYDNTTAIETTTVTTLDFVPLFDRSVTIPAGKNISALIRDFCKMSSTTYDSAAVYLGSYCGDNSNYTLTVSGNNYSFSATPENGTAGIMDIPEGEFSAYIENNGDTDLTCSTHLLGYGLDTTPEEGYNISLTCYDKLPSGGSRLRGLGLLLLSILFAL